MNDFRKVGFAVFLGLVLALFVGNVLAAPTFRSTDQNDRTMQLVLLNDSCKDEKVLKHIKHEWHAKLRAARLTWGGQEWSSCWIEIDGLIYSVDEAGAPLQAIPRRAFRDYST